MDSKMSSLKRPRDETRALCINKCPVLRRFLAGAGGINPRKGIQPMKTRISLKQVTDVAAITALAGTTIQTTRKTALLLFCVALLLSSSAAAARGQTLGNYPDQTVIVGGNTTVSPDAAPTNTTGINVSTVCDFKGVLIAD